MNSIWNNLYDKFKDRRYGVLFFVSLLSVFGLLLLAAILDQIIGPANLQEYFPQVLPGIGIFIVALIWRAIRRARAQRGRRFRREELSRDEIRKARSKLVNRYKT
jgi:O-antigen/teichoic acid export membrane protein